MPPTNPIVLLDSVDVDIDGQPVLHEIQFSILPGQQWGIVGANGSGKSTLLALLSGRRWPAPARGTRVYDFGEGPERDAISARERIALIGHELQDLYVARRWNFRAEDIVLSGLTRSDIPQRRASNESREEARALLKTMNLGHLADRRLLELSRGEQRRVLIARSLAFKPALLLLDEPASGLDAESRAELAGMLGRVVGRTQIVTTAHRTEDLPAVVTDIAQMDAGRLRLIRIPERRLAPVSAGVSRDTNPRDTATSTQDRVMIELTRATAWLGERQVLKAIDWQLRSGEHWLITGDNGAGKSTLLRMLHAEIRPARGGTVTWPGLGNPQNVWALRRKVALVSPELQARYRFPTRVYDAIASGFHASIGLIQPLSEQQHRSVAALLAEFELEPFKDRLLSTLSYGQRHRALIARTLATNPSILLLDEPWEGLDSRTSDIVATQIGRRMAAGAQVVCVSHIGPRGLALNRQMTLQSGRIVHAGDSGVPRENSANAHLPASGYPQH
jgi:molybdate transport system ATP-binding protein